MQDAFDLTKYLFFLLQFGLLLAFNTSNWHINFGFHLLISHQLPAVVAHQVSYNESFN
jgi:hypothetical protein